MHLYQPLPVVMRVMACEHMIQSYTHIHTIYAPYQRCKSHVITSHRKLLTRHAYKHIHTHHCTNNLRSNYTKTHQINLLGRVLHTCPRSALIPPECDLSDSKIWMETIRYSNTFPRALEPSFFLLDSSRTIVEIMVPVVHLHAWTEMLLASHGRGVSLSRLAVAASRRPSTTAVAHVESNGSYIRGAHSQASIGIAPSALVLEVTYSSKFSLVEDAAVRNVPVRTDQVLSLRVLMEGKEAASRATVIVKVRSLACVVFV
jgi:hypothetical protein